MRTKNTREGAAARALLKISRTARSDSPTYLFRSCGIVRHSVVLWSEHETHLGTFYSEEVNPALCGARAYKKGLTAPGRAVQQHTTGWEDAESRERVRVQQRPLHALAQLLNRVCLPADRGITHGGEIEQERAQCGWTDRRQCGEQVREGELGAVRRGLRRARCAGCRGGKPALDRECPCFAHDGAEVGSDVPVCFRSDGAEVVRRDRVWRL